MATVEPKLQVNQFCQKKCGRQIMKADITYTTQKHGNAYQSTITISCLGGVAFVGELVGNAKQAESAAAQQVLRHYASEISALAALPPAPKGVKRPASQALAIPGVGIAGPGAPQVEVPIPPKQEITQICTKILRRTLTKTEIVYNSKAVAGGFQSTLQLGCLPGVYGQNMFSGTVCANKKEAEASVAAIAVQTLKADTEFAEIINKPKEVKGKGKGKWYDPALYKIKMCVNYQSGMCNRGANCTFAHDESELQEAPHNPALYKTKICDNYAEGTCGRGDKCVFAHGEGELREPPKIEQADWDEFAPMMAMMWNMMGGGGGGWGGGGKKRKK